MALAPLLHAWPAVHQAWPAVQHVLPSLICVPALLGTVKTCRNCDAELASPFIDLGSQPLANSYLHAAQLQKPEPLHPLRVFFCEKCHLAQAVDFIAADEIFDEYFYYSSFSKSWLEHARRYVDMAVPRLKLTHDSRVIEIASNDGYLLQYFKEKGIPSLGIEPSKTVAKAAIEKGIDTWIKFFGVTTAHEIAEKKLTADLIIGNNVLAHVPDLHDFVGGLKIALKSTGVATFEFPHLLRLLEQNQFDTIYHEHFSYFSLLAVEKIFAGHGLVIYDVEELPTHGGSLRLWVRHAENAALPVTARVSELRFREKTARLDEPATYRRLAENAERVRADLLEFLKGAKEQNRTVVAYGAPAKGNTLLNFCRVDNGLIRYTVDANPHKQGCYLPGSRIAIQAPEIIFETRPDYVLILPWNLKDEIVRQMAGIGAWNGKFVVPIPRLTVITPDA